MVPVVDFDGLQKFFLVGNATQVIAAHSKQPRLTSDKRPPIHPPPRQLRPPTDRVIDTWLGLSDCVALHPAPCG